jgi:hypothetical protein
MTDEKTNDDDAKTMSREEAEMLAATAGQHAFEDVRPITMPGGGKGEGGPRWKVQEEDELLLLRKNYRPLDGAKVEFNIHEAGLSIVANKEGWQSLADWCQIMAHPDMGEFSDPYELTDSVFPAEMFNEDRAILAFWGIEQTENAWYQDVFFHRTGVIGDELWGGDPKSGNSPRTKAFMCQTLDSFKWIVDMPRTEVEAELGQPLFEALLDDDTRTVVYKADSPDGWIGIDYDAEGTGIGFGFSSPPPWEDEALPAVEIVVEYKGLE